MMSHAAKAAVFNGVGKPMDIRSYPLIAPGKGDVSLRMIASGICGTDVHIVKGRLALPAMDVIIGHEFIGEITGLGDGVTTDGLGNAIAVGDKAIACVAVPCGTCFNCRRGETASCLNFGVTYMKDPAAAPHFFGGYAEHLMSPAKNLVRVPDGIAVDAVAAFPCAGPTVLRAFEYAGGIDAGAFVVVQGTGPMGLFAIAYAANMGATVIAVGSAANPERIRLAKAFGASAVLDYRSSAQERIDSIMKAAREHDRGNGADIVIETSGSPASFVEGLSIIRTRGKYIVPGQYSSSGAVSISPEMITFKAVTIVGSGQYTLADIGAYCAFIQNHPGHVPIFSQCITHRYSIEDADIALENAANGISIKGVFTC
ncbi:MAG: alcohol dehydrogenase catalytic domain-containing protein [Spirochaetota bacterium]